MRALRRMQLTDYHAKYFAHELTKRCPSDSAEKLAGALVDAQVDLNPHQVEAALFAFRSPLSRGALLADEVGLGKTIEAGLVISQRCAERKRRILIITPSNLRKQWHQELSEKFFLPCRILESRFYNDAVKQGNFRPFEANDVIIICSYQFARSKAADVANTPWHLVVIDEAHRLRNVYKPSNVIPNTLKLALKDAPKLLLTATPIQNSLLELFGLVSFVDEYAFGDLASFRAQFSHLTTQEVFDTLKARLRPMCHRTLRRQVTAYVPFTRRHPMMLPFTPEESEDRLYHLVSDYLRRDNLQALPKSQRSLMTLVLRKLLASSSFAIAGALATLGNRLKDRLRRETPKAPELELAEDYEALDETADEWPEDEPQPEPLSDAGRTALEQEVADLEGFRSLAVSITSNAKGRALLVALEHAFGEAERLGAARKAIIFTESRRTQEYLLRILADRVWQPRREDHAARTIDWPRWRDDAVALHRGVARPVRGLSRVLGEDGRRAGGRRGRGAAIVLAAGGIGWASRSRLSNSALRAACFASTACCLTSAANRACWAASRSATALSEAAAAPAASSYLFSRSDACSTLPCRLATSLVLSDSAHSIADVPGFPSAAHSRSSASAACLNPLTASSKAGFSAFQASRRAFSAFSIRRDVNEVSERLEPFLGLRFDEFKNGRPT